MMSSNNEFPSEGKTFDLAGSNHDHCGKKNCHGHEKDDDHCRGKKHGHGPEAKDVRHMRMYTTMDLENKLIVNLRETGHMIRFLFEGKGSQKRILIILHESGGMTQRELTERLGVKPGSASEVIGKLESAGLILRTSSREDRRTTDIRLTEAGREKAEEALSQRKQRHQEMFSCLSEEEKADFLRLLEKLNADWDERYRSKN